LHAQVHRDIWHVSSNGAACVEEATWEPLQAFRDLYPDVQLKDELFDEAGRDVMAGALMARMAPAIRG
jgi:transcriptional regulator GlxA family with amidase domain